MKNAVKFVILCVVLTIVFYQIMLAASGAFDGGGSSLGDAVSRYLSGLPGAR